MKQIQQNLGTDQTDQSECIHRFSTGAVRGCEADGERWDLMPVLGLWRLARTCAEGAARYGVGNWLRGIPISDLVNHALRHLYLYLAGERSEDHLAHAVWNLLAACHMELVQPEMRDVLWQAPAPAFWKALEEQFQNLFWYRPLKESVGGGHTQTEKERENL